MLFGFSVSMIWPFHDIKTKHDICRRINCMKKFCEFLKEHAMEIN